ncbi:MAG: hypothetical protein OXG19_01555 [Chloroflexi bacterium]|nr:hypothetical protein [Chloroflexota bacterium]
MKRWIIGTLAVALALAAGTSVAVAQEGPAAPATATVEVAVWRSVANPADLYLSTRLEGGRWRRESTALDMSALDASNHFHLSNAVSAEVFLAGAGTVAIEARVWRSVANPARIYLSTRPAGERWRTEGTALDMSALDALGRFHQSNAVPVAVPLARAAPTIASSAAGEEPFTYIPTLDARVVELRFFESGFYSPPRDARVYRTTFSRSTTRYVSWQLNLAHSPKPERNDYTIEAVFHRPNGSVLARQTAETYIDEGWTSSYYSESWGWREPGHWPPGQYRVELLIANQPVAVGAFQVVDNAIPRAGPFANLRANLAWAADPLTLEARTGLLALAGLQEADPALATAVAAFPWVRDGLSEDGLRALQHLAILAGADAGLASRVAAFPWLADDITAEEGLAGRTLALLAGDDGLLAHRIADRAWVADGITEDERRTIARLRDLANAGASAISNMSFLKTLSQADVWAVQALRSLAYSDFQEFHWLLERPLISDGIADGEATIVSTLRRVKERNPTLLETLLDPQQVRLEERSIELPLAGAVQLTIIRTRPGAERTMDLLERAVRANEAFTEIPLPLRQVTYLFTDGLTRGFRGTNFGSYIVSVPGIDEPSYSEERAFKHFAHEAAHYYWTGNQFWLNEGAAQLVEAVASHQATGYAIIPEYRPCPDLRTIAAVEALEITPTYSVDILCHYALGERLFHDLYRTLGEPAFRRGFRNLYLLSQSDDPEDECEDTSLTICHVAAAFKASAGEEMAATVDRIVARWYDGSEPYNISYLNIGPADPGLPDYEGEITGAYISLHKDREQQAPVERLSTEELMDPLHLILEFAFARSEDPRTIPLVLAESYEDGFVHERRSYTINLQTELTSPWWRFSVGPRSPEQNWAVGRHWVQVYQGEQKVAEVSYEVTP